MQQSIMIGRTARGSDAGSDPPCAPGWQRRSPGSAGAPPSRRGMPPRPPTPNRSSWGTPSSWSPPCSASPDGSMCSCRPSTASRSASPCPSSTCPDGGLGEDFLHIAGLVQVLVCNGGMRPFIVVGIENTQRRRDLTGPTGRPRGPRDRPGRRRVRPLPAVHPRGTQAGGPHRYDITAESAILGESLAGLFVVETLLLEPDLFDAYIAVDPSLWWDNTALVTGASRAGEQHGRQAPLPGQQRRGGARGPDRPARGRVLASPDCRHAPMPEESHATIFHPAALRGLRGVLAPTIADGAEAQ